MTRFYITLYDETDATPIMRNAYNRAGRLTRINDWLDGTVGIQYDHDALGRLTAITDYDYNKQLSYSYDAAGRIASMTDYNGHVTNYTWTARGQLASITAPGSRVWNFQYNALGQRAQYTHPNGMRTEYQYDGRNRLTGIYHKNASTDAVLDSYVYTLNNGGAITRMDQADNSYWTYGYDQRNRLGLATRRNTLGNVLHIFGYEYDAADNMTQRWRFQASNDQTDIWEYDYNTANEQIAMTLNAGTPETRTYDPWGRLATRAQGAYSAAYGYRYGSRLYQATSNFPGESNVTYDYGGDGKRRWRVDAYETRRYRHDRGWNVIHEEDGNGYTWYTNFFEPGQAVGQRLAQSIGVATAYQVYAVHDHLGTVRHWRLHNQNSARAYEHDPYGNPYAGGGVFSLPNIYALYEYDTALQQFRAPWRDYSPAMARWTTPDPLGMVDGTNVFAYVKGNPVNYMDLYGLSSWCPSVIRRSPRRTWTSRAIPRTPPTPTSPTTIWAADVSDTTRARPRSPLTSTIPPAGATAPPAPRPTTSSPANPGTPTPNSSTSPSAITDP